MHYVKMVFVSNNRYPNLIPVVKTALVLCQNNADSERSLSVNGRIVTKDRPLLGEQTIVGLHAVKDAVKYFDPVHNRPEMVPLSKELKRSVRQAHSAYKERLQKEKEQEEKKKEEERRQKELQERVQKEKQQMLAKQESLAKDESRLNEEEEQIKERLEAADALLSQASTRLQEALAIKPLNKTAVEAATMILETANLKRKQALDAYEGVRKRQKVLEKSTVKLLMKALPKK